MDECKRLKKSKRINRKKYLTERNNGYKGAYVVTVNTVQLACFKIWLCWSNSLQLNDERSRKQVNRENQVLSLCCHSQKLQDVSLGALINEMAKDTNNVSR